MTHHLNSDALLGDVHGERALFLGPQIPDHAPPAVREGIARRRIVTLGQPCPCGAAPPALSRQQRRQLDRDRRKHRRTPIRLRVAHEPDCPAVDDTLLPALRRWLATTSTKGTP
jgi:hypothetical protein